MGKKLIKRISIAALGFGLGGFLWGLILYLELPDLEYPFHFMAIIVMGLFGGLALAWPDLKDIKKVSKAVLAGFLGWSVGFFVGAILVYFLTIIGVLLLSIFSPSFLIEYLELKPKVGITVYWLVFMSAGGIIGLFYALFFKLKIWPLAWRAGIGLALGSLIGPVLGNLLGNAFNCLLLSYLVTFSMIGLILGKFIAWGIYQSQKSEK